ncbi:unnamed protein product [Owenia fusiformis]|uniref:Uncharacterized protein n=1 Tax=Owenia fusiformis TaxID=6347 RepID=A0A8J1TUQ8_OWEFU|nr:unnamed protein product [Owenia fusiformis]
MTSLTLVLTCTGLGLAILPSIQTTLETSKWIFKCGPSETECNRRTHYCESKMDKCTSCWDYCSEKRIKGHPYYRIQCHKYCPVWMRNQEMKKLMAESTKEPILKETPTLTNTVVPAKEQGDHTSATDPIVIKVTGQWTSIKTLTAAGVCLAFIVLGFLAVFIVKNRTVNNPGHEEDLEKRSLNDSTDTNDTTVQMDTNTKGNRQKGNADDNINIANTIQLPISDKGADVRVACSVIQSAPECEDVQSNICEPQSKIQDLLQSTYV